LIRININWKKTFLVIFDVVIAGYLVMAMTSWNKPVEHSDMCTKVKINIADENENGFLNSKEIKSLLERNRMYPLSRPIAEINTRSIEERLTHMPFVNTAQCYTTTDGYVCITVTQRTPIIRVKSNNGDDYYLDDNGGVMPNSQYTSDMIIVTGAVTRHYATHYVVLLAQIINSSELWSRQIEQINILPDKSVELVPRVGDHIAYLGKPVQIQEKLERLRKFYKYGLSYAGWNKYERISVEFDNQIVCKKAKVGN
jgi:cell division protein FtsQ